MNAASLRALLTVMALTLACAAVLWATQRFTAPQIAMERAAALRAGLADLAGARRLQGLVHIDQWPLRLCEQLTLVQSTPRGYGGPITLAVALTPGLDGAVVHRLKTLRHQETPGIGDFIADAGADSWLARFRGLSAVTLAARPAAADAVSGATITATAVRQGLLTTLAAAAEQPALFSVARCQDAGR